MFFVKKSDKERLLRERERHFGNFLFNDRVNRTSTQQQGNHSHYDHDGDDDHVIMIYVCSIMIVCVEV